MRLMREGWARFRLSQVDVRYQRTTKRFLPLSELKKHHLQHRAAGGPLKDVALFTRARLSVQPLTTGMKEPAQKQKKEYVSAGLLRNMVSSSADEFDFILSLEDKEPLWGFDAVKSSRVPSWHCSCSSLLQILNVFIWNYSPDSVHELPFCWKTETYDLSF